MKRIAIVGGGPGGLMLARMLELHGMAPIVFERDVHADDRPQGGSLDLHDDTGQHAIRRARLEHEFALAARPEDQGDRLYDANGQLLFESDGIGHNRPEIDRTELRRILIGSLTPGTIRWNSRIVKVVPAGNGYAIVGDDWQEDFDIVIGADGAWSRVRSLLSDAEPIYEGVAFAELGFDSRRHPAIDALTGAGKMFAVGKDSALITQRNGFGHIRGYAGIRAPEEIAAKWRHMSEVELRAELQRSFADWAPTLRKIVETGDIIGARPLYALPIGHRWNSQRGLTLLGDAAHVMSPFAGQGVNLALADAVDLADAIANDEDWSAITAFEETMVKRAAVAAAASADGLRSVFSRNGAQPVLDHYRERAAPQSDLLQCP
ncbi:NAD(P)/FAD-dependent oxidoreductase [Novosphingobium sp. BL-8A]|uniref:FAD-dependent oxidoreductase n=1 Tax=Novosphingobium sp. BL-8A TaxID=3127639 RepID=UPI0037563E75